MSETENRAASGAAKIGLTVDEAAAYSGIGRATLRQLIEWEKLPALHIGRRLIIHIRTLERFMECNLGHDLLNRDQVCPVA